MRRGSSILLACFLSTLAIIGGSRGVAVCVDQVGGWHATGVVAGAEEEAEEACGCDENCLTECSDCLDVELRGLDLADHRPGEGASHPPPAPLLFVEFPAAFPAGCFASDLVRPPGRAPPFLPFVRVVAATTVLLL